MDNILSAHAYLVDGSNIADELAEQVAAVMDYVQDFKHFLTEPSRIRMIKDVLMRFEGVFGG